LGQEQNRAAFCDRPSPDHVVRRRRAIWSCAPRLAAVPPRIMPSPLPRTYLSLAHRSRTLLEMLAHVALVQFTNHRDVRGNVGPATLSRSRLMLQLIRSYMLRDG